MTVLNDTLTETVTLSEASDGNAILQAAVADGVRAFAFLDVVYVQPVTVTETVTLTATPSFALGVVVTERIVVGLSSIENSKFQLTLADTLTAIDQISVGTPVTINETITVSLDQLAQQAVSVIEQLGIAATVAPIFTYNVSIAETLSLASSLANFFGVDITESIGIAETVAGVALRAAAIDETIAISAAVAPQLVLKVTVEDSIALGDASILNAIYSGTIDENITVSAAYLSPGGGITTWVMNTRTAAVSEYSNFAFNSFAQMGDKYLGASQDGLYELVGDDDDGVDIVAEIKSGFAQWAGTKFTMFKGIYLGVRGSGNFVLKLITGDDKTYVYTVNASDMRTTKITVGKGPRARYFAFELISTGQDFDLDTIEFVPIISDRRV